MSIVGGGAASLSLVNAVKRKYKEFANIKLTIRIFDEKVKMGRGNAYLKDSHSNLMNTRAGYLTFDERKPRDFLNWVENESDLALSIGEEEFVSRALFGEYLLCRWKSIVKADIDNVEVIEKDEKILSIMRKENDFLLINDLGESYKSDFLILATGTTNRIIDDKIYTLGAKIIQNPYPTQSLIQRVDMDRNIAVIGSRLSAIDTIISLKESGYNGKIAMHCINGTFPSVRGIQGRYTNTYLCKNHINCHFKNSITLSDIMELYSKEVEYYRTTRNHSTDEDITGLFNKYPINSLETYLEDEISLASKDRAWQAVLYDTNRSLSDIWSLIKDIDKKYVLSDVLNKLMAMRVSIPVENAEKMLSFIKSNEVIFSSGKFEFCKDRNMVELRPEKGDITNDIGTIIFATGSPSNISESDFTLGKQLIETGVLVKDELGGIKVSKYYRPIDNRGKEINNMFVIGELTKGRHLFTAALDIIRHQAEECSEQVIKSLGKYDLSDINTRVEYL
ncbi:FAD/NAD(P)-binding protein [Gilliamella sp. wkB72]|uniref:FAD/NAD(P)-binding protein n=1 Tax=Gilliamella sp. wkB72 TaxID=3120265 RepID=UPI00159EFBCE|nr:FAD/NAD(P)-binding protein [Gilliamella apicola]